MSLASGTRVGPYEIVALLGAGGMGEVYRARDARLGRDVAIKVLPRLFAGDAERLARFTREARALAALNHPNIAHVLGLEQSDGAHALVMELVEGDDLSTQITRGAMPLADVLGVARQIADALETAHDHGIVHRDLKPANIKITPDGTVKVLDFGLAKTIEPAVAVAVDNSPTLTAESTHLGVIVGTAAYMAPEQARGKAVDRRADIWAFGVVVCEMLTGRPMFAGEGVSDILAGVLRQEIDWSALPPSTPARLRALLERCLDRDPKSRLRDIGEARIEIGRLVAGAPDRAPLPAAAVPGRRWLPWSIAATLGVVAALALWAPWRPAVDPERIRLVMPARPGSPIAANPIDRNVAMSPDGRHVAYVSQDGSLIVRAIDQLEAAPVRGAAGVRNPFFSPNGRWVGFFDPVGLKKIAVDGGPVVSICAFDGTPRGAAWGSDDVIVFATANATTGLLAVPAGGGEATVLTRPDSGQGELDHFWPTFLPGGDAVLFTIVPPSPQIESMQVALLDRRTGKVITLFRGGTDAAFAPSADGSDGFLVYAAVGSLRAVRFDPRARRIAGDAVPVVDGVQTNANGAAQYGLSQSGTLVYQPGGQSGANANRSLVWVDRQGREEPIGPPPRGYYAVRVAPDGTRLALEIRDVDNDIWVWSIAGRTLTRLTSLPGIDSLPVWTTDSRRIVFYSTSGANNLFWLPADGSGAPERLTTSPDSQAPLSFTPDGKTLLVRERRSQTGDDLAIMPMETRQAMPFIRTPFSENNAQISPDGRWLAYESNEVPPSQVYVQPFPDINSGRWQVSSGGGTKPVWAPNGRELFYETASAIMAVPVQTQPTFSFGPAVKLFDASPIPTLISGRSYDVTPDGQRFVLIKEPPPDPNAPRRPDLTVVVHWTTELGAKVPRR